MFSGHSEWANPPAHQRHAKLTTPSLNTNGQDSLGNTVLCQQIFLSKDLKKWRQKIKRNSNLAPAYLDSINKSLDRLEWTLYSLKSCTLLDFEKTQLMKPPSCPKPESHHETEDYIGWTPYPQPHPPVDFHPDCHYLSFVSIIEKSARAEALMAKQEETTSKETMQELAELYTGVRNWHKTLPECMNLDGRSPPHVIALQLETCPTNIQRSLLTIVLVLFTIGSL